MPLTRVQKQEIITELEDLLLKQKEMVFVDFSGLKAKKILELRKRLKKQNCLLKVPKKTLLKVAFNNVKIPFTETIGEIPGQLAVVFGFEDEIIPAKITYEFSKESEDLKILTGIIKDKNYRCLTKEEIIELAKLSSKEELLAKFIGSISSPVSNFVNILKGNIKGLLYVLTQIKT